MEQMELSDPILTEISDQLTLQSKAEEDIKRAQAAQDTGAESRAVAIISESVEKVAVLKDQLKTVSSEASKKMTALETTDKVVLS